MEAVRVTEDVVAEGSKEKTYSVTANTVVRTGHVGHAIKAGFF
jgi:hypothetical protein